jgi:anti-anti-sigma regulatory factor
MLRIAAEDAEGGTVLRLEGQVIGPWVDELRAICETACGRRGPLALDLAAVTFVSREGVQLLLELRARAVTLRHCSGFVREQFRAAEVSQP